jgi:hypothetical protein
MKGGRDYLLTGNLLVLNKIGRAADAPLSKQGDRLYLFLSDDLKSRKYLHVFYERRTELQSRHNWSCPARCLLQEIPVWVHVKAGS